MTYKKKMEKQGKGVTEPSLTDILKTLSAEHSPLPEELQAAEVYRQSIVRFDSAKIIENKEGEDQEDENEPKGPEFDLS